MSKHFGTDINAQLTEDLRHTLVEATFATVLLDEVRAMSAEARRAWLRTASAQQIERLAVCYAVEAGDMDLVAEFVAKLQTKQAELRAEMTLEAATPLRMAPQAVLAAAADDLMAQHPAGSPVYNAVKRARGWLARGIQPVVSGAVVLMPSSQDVSSLPYAVRPCEGGYACDCRAGVEGKACWHAHALAIVDRAWELLAEQDADQGGDDDGEEGGERIAPFGPDPAAGFPAERAMVDTGASLGARLARARRAIAA
jgi:hypothetical protein